jgi:hypothetical protein
MIENKKGTCQWCKKELPLDLVGRIIEHRNPGDKYKCLGSGVKPLEAKRI